ncbi:MAG TPA: CbiQ family ECF transporter T component [Polyangiales bacterium]|nr:CbiQ family ECF transporter T component [Polyangiales bacterium]
MNRYVRVVCVGIGLAYVLASAEPLGSLVLSGALLPWLTRTASGRRALRARVRAVVPLVVGLCLSWLLIAAVSGESGWVALDTRAYPVAARVVAATLLLSWLTHDLSALQLERALLALRLPAAFVALVMETRAFAQQLTETLHAAWAACALRGGLSSLSALRHTIGGVAGVVLLRSIDRSERVAVASALRGLGASLCDDELRGDAATVPEYEPRAKLS